MGINNNIWRFCVVGNIKTQHFDEEGKILYGTKAFVGGTKVYIDDRTWNLNAGKANVIGLNRFGRYDVEDVRVDLIENLRVQRIFKPKVLEIMEYLEVTEGWPWRGRTADDRRTLNTFVEMCNKNQ